MSTTNVNVTVHVYDPGRLKVRAGAMNRSDTVIDFASDSVMVFLAPAAAWALHAALAERLASLPSDAGSTDASV